MVNESANPNDINAISHVVPSALLEYGLPDLAVVLGEKPAVEQTRIQSAAYGRN